MSHKRILTNLSILFLIYILNFSSCLADDSSPNKEDIQRFANTLYQIKQYYVSKVNDSELFDNAIRGMLNGLDPHSTYLNDNDYKELEIAASGNFAGLGIEVTTDNGVIKIVTPLVDGPAYRAGIKPGDYILKIDSHVTQGLSLEQAVKLMRGKTNSTVKLVIVRKDQKKPLFFDIKREKIAMKSVASKLLNGHFGYIRLAQFQENTAKDMQAAVAGLELESHGRLKGLILDLRNNPGGLLNSAIEVADAFIDSNQQKKLIVYTEGRLPETKFTALATPGDILHRAPLVVLINSGSASAAEIVAGALKDNKRALMLGTQSFGKGSVQTVIPLSEHQAIKLTTALYYTPSGTSIQAKGITPDIVIRDLHIPKEGNNPLIDYNEASLSGHLVAKPAKKTIVKLAQKDNQDLINEDFQLYSALTILQSLGLQAQR
ncbi:MAG: peptidase S41 [Legionellaceae bacterium]|nr:peptidase S41 [Legionellaceae bacterium]